MSVTVKFSCGGCDAVADGVGPLRVKFVSISGRSHGIGSVLPANTVEDICPPGWVAFDPYTFCTYCPACWAEIEGSRP